jgi:hypothetical protein
MLLDALSFVWPVKSTELGVARLICHAFLQ